MYILKRNEHGFQYPYLTTDHYSNTRNGLLHIKPYDRGGLIVMLACLSSRGELI